ncbi:MAG TPA: hypothetical protein VL171_04725, partial [Verrucomicrobiae bacterium]|nr:hypothetical protein [Verrucomicrobiae bacterium]
MMKPLVFPAVCSPMALAVVLYIGFSAMPVQAQSTPAPANTIFVHSKFGGQIFGFDIDQNGTEGVLSEAQDINGGVLAAVETFDQRTGKILKVIAKKQSQADDFVTLGVVGNGVGLVEYEHEVKFLDVKRYFPMLDPLTGNKFSSLWTPPLGKTHLIMGVSRNQGEPNTAVFALDNGNTFQPWVFSSNVAANTFSQIVIPTDDRFSFGIPPVIAYDSKENVAVIAQDFGSPTDVPEIGLIDLTAGTFDEFRGVGFGLVNGIAVDSDDHIACTTTEIDFSVEFYDLQNQTGFSEFLPNANDQIFSGADVEYDPIHKVFLVAQPVSSTSPSGSSIQVYDTKGNFLESVNGLNFSNAFNVIAAHIALHPSKRAGFIDGPD